VGAAAEAESPVPVDAGLARRVFLARMAGLTAAAVGGPALFAPAGAAAAGPQLLAASRQRTDRGVPAALRGPNAYAPPRPEAIADPTELTVAEAGWLIRAGRLSPRDLVEARLDRIAAFDGVYQAFNVVLAGEALAAAAHARSGPYRGVLTGIPLSIKDNYYTRGVPTTANSYLYADFVPPFDATAVARLVGAGGIVLGKTQMGPLATTRATTPNGIITTVNAWTPTDPSVDPGGSSTGTATSVAGRMASGGTGTQTGGSITAPSNAQNLTGLKPTMGRVSLYGIIPLSYTRDHPGALARDAKDAAILLTAMAGEDPHDFRTQGLPPVPDLVTAATPVRRGAQVRARWRTRVGVIPGYTSDANPTAVARRAFLGALAAVPGLSVVDVTLPPDWETLTSNAFNNVRLPERSEAFLPRLRSDLTGFGVSLTGWLQGALLGGNEFLLGQRAKLLLLSRVLDVLFGQCDVVVQTSPTPFDSIGLPELGLPIGFDGGRPIGTILGGQPYAEDRLLAVAAAYQAVTDWHHRRPADPPTTAAAGPRPTARSGRLAAARPDPGRGRITADQVPDLMQ
jgi:Asp-tRNA(Asn)/Glu-tRNA(Gln) amidotransferase A subunit family amidase